MYSKLISCFPLYIFKIIKCNLSTQGVSLLFKTVGLTTHDQKTPFQEPPKWASGVSKHNETDGFGNLQTSPNPQGKSMFPRRQEASFGISHLNGLTLTHLLIS